MGEIIEGVVAKDFNPELVNDNVSVDNSRAVKVSTLFVEKITSLYNKKAEKFENNQKDIEEPAYEPEVQSEEPNYESEESTYEPEVQSEEPNYESEESTYEPEIQYEEEDNQEQALPEEPTYEIPLPEVEIPTVPIADPDGMLSDIASSFEVAVAQIHSKQKELEIKELEIERIKAELSIKEEKTNNLLDELEKMKKDVEVSKRDADKIVKEAETQEKALQRRITVFEKEREKFLNNLKATSSSIINMVDKK